MKILRHHWWLLAAFFIVAKGHARTFEVPGPSSPLQGRAEPAWAPDRDFDGLQGHPPCNVGAYEPDERPQHPGWRIQPGFKN